MKFMSKIIVSFRRTYEVKLDDIENVIKLQGMLLSDKNIEKVAIELARGMFDYDSDMLTTSEDDFSAHIISN